MRESLRLNTLSSRGSAYKRIGRGIGSGFGKTSGRGHKGQRSRAGACRSGRNEGGQMPLYRRVPKRGFRSRLARRTMQMRLGVINRLPTEETISLPLLRARGLLPHFIKRVKIFGNSGINKAVVVSGIGITHGARKAIERTSGKVE